MSGQRTASGAVILANDPHRQVTNPSLRYIVHLNAPGWDVIGATEPAIPGVAIGHNGRVGWGLTIVGTDYDDVFVEEVNPENPNQAKWQGQWYPLRVVEDTIQVRGETPRKIQRKYSRHGPIFFEDRVRHRAYALRSTLQERGTAEYLGALRLNQASLTPTCREFLKYQQYYLAPSENMICGDVDGNIGWHASALTPKRAGGWDGRLPVPGTGEYTWNGFRDDLPFEYNPERGYIATANHNIHPAGYSPPLFFKRAPYSRFDRLNQLLGTATGLRAEDFERFQYDTLWPYIEAEKSLLRGWSSDVADVEWARQTILEWDGRYVTDSVAPSLHNRWRDNLDEAALQLEGWLTRGGVGSSALRIGLADQTKARVTAARTALEQAVQTLRKSLGPDRQAWRWGRLNRSEFPHPLLKAYDLPGVERNGGGETIAAIGATYRHVLDFADLDNSRATNTPGQSAQPGSPFYDNLREQWAKGQYFPLRYRRASVDEAAAHRLDAGSGEVIVHKSLRRPTGLLSALTAAPSPHGCLIRILTSIYCPYVRRGPTRPASAIPDRRGSASGEVRCACRIRRRPGEVASAGIDSSRDSPERSGARSRGTPRGPLPRSMRCGRRRGRGQTPRVQPRGNCCT